MGWGEPTSQAASLEANPYSIDEAKAIAAHLQLDNICYVLRAPVYAERLAGQDGRLFYGPGIIKSEADLALLQLPDPYDDALYEDAQRFSRTERGPCRLVRYTNRHLPDDAQYGHGRFLLGSR